MQCYSLDVFIRSVHSAQWYIHDAEQTDFLCDELPTNGTGEPRFKL